MNNASRGDIYTVIWLVRRLFQRMASENDAMHSASGITASKRGILESLARKEPQSVPHMARERSVSRQNVQVIINDLLAEDLIETRDNPAHKRSALIQRSAAGRRISDEIRAREIAVIADMVTEFDTPALRTTARTLQGMMDYFDSHTWESMQHSADDEPG